MPLTFILSRKGDKLLVYENTRYELLQSKEMGDRTTWRCIEYKNTNCPRIIHTSSTNPDGKILETCGQHNHVNLNAVPVVPKIIIATVNKNRNFVTLPDGTPAFPQIQLSNNNNNNNNGASRTSGISKSLETFLNKLSKGKEVNTNFQTMEEPKNEIQKNKNIMMVQTLKIVDEKTSEKFNQNLASKRKNENLTSEKLNSNQILKVKKLKTNNNVTPTKKKFSECQISKVKILKRNKIRTPKKDDENQNLQAKILEENKDLTPEKFVTNLPLKSEIIVEEILSDLEDSLNVSGNKNEKPVALTEQQNLTETFNKNPEQQNSTDKNPSSSEELLKCFDDTSNFNDDKKPKLLLDNQKSTETFDKNSSLLRGVPKEDKYLTDQEKYSKLNIDELAELLGTIIKHPDTIKILKDELIDGSMFLELTDNDLKEINIKLGPRKLILREINKAKENKSELIKPRAVVKDEVKLSNEIINVTPLLIPKILFEEESNIMKIHSINEEICKDIVDENADVVDEKLADITPPLSAEILFEDIKCEPNIEEILPNIFVDDDPLELSALSNRQIPFKFSRYKTVKATLLNHPIGKKLLESKNPLFTQKDKKLFLHILVDELIQVYIKHNVYCYPPQEAKISLAKAIITEFPSLKDDCAGPNGYEHLYNPLGQKGSIENKLIKMRSKYSLSQENYNSIMKNDIPQGIIEIDENDFQSTVPEKLFGDHEVFPMGMTEVTESNKEGYRTWLKETFAARRKWIKDHSPSISKILGKYPQLFYYNGEMIDAEFEMLFPARGNNLINKFSVFTKKILAMSRNHLYRFPKGRFGGYKYIYQDCPNFTDDNFRALAILAQTLSTVDNSKDDKRQNQRKYKRKRATSIDEKENDENSNPLVKIVPDDYSIEEYIELIRGKEDNNTVSIILMNEQSFYPAYIYGGGNLLTLNCGKLEPIKIVDLFYKYTHVMGLKYPKELEKFFNLLDCHFYRMLGVRSHEVVTSMYIEIYNYQIPGDKDDDDDDDDVTVIEPSS